MSNSPIQKIYFGSPGTGKSHAIEITDLKTLEITKNSETHIHAVFHPEYTYGDFMGKLVPITKAGKVEYKYRSGHFLRALGQAYKNINAANAANAANVVLVIDEINRGNCAAIFGAVFQLLDREKSGWSSYAISLNEIEFEALLSEMGLGIGTNSKGEPVYFDKEGRTVEDISKLLKKVSDASWELSFDKKSIKLPGNLSIIASMNTSDNSVYLMDSAFKRRWDWKFIAWEGQKDPSRRSIADITPNTGFEWVENSAPTITTNTTTTYRWAPEGVTPSFIVELNRFIKSHHESIRGIEDKQIGPFFIAPHVSPIPLETFQSKVMHFIWDTIFQRDKKPLMDVINEYYRCYHSPPVKPQLQRKDLVTFGDFEKLTEDFVNAIMMPRCEWNGKLVPAAAWNGKLQPAVEQDGSLVAMQTAKVWQVIIGHMRREDFGLRVAQGHQQNNIPLPKPLQPTSQTGPDDLHDVATNIKDETIRSAAINAIADAAGKSVEDLEPQD